MNWSTRTFAAAVGACFALAACSASGMPPSSGFQNGSPSLLRASSAPPTLYVLNRQVSKTVGWVSVYANAGATFTRKFGNLGEEGAYVAADQAGHVYLYTGRVPGQVQIYEKY